MFMKANQENDQCGTMVREILHAFKRAGADIIVSYHARDAIGQQWIE